MSDKRKASIRTVGVAVPSAVSELWPDGVVSGWVMEGGDHPGIDYTTGKFGGWSVDELALIAEVGRSHGHKAAVDLAERCR